MTPTRRISVMRIVQWCLVAACLIQLGVFVRKQTRLRVVVDGHRDQQHHADPFPDLAADEVRRSEPSPAVQRVGQHDRLETRPRTVDPFPDLLNDERLDSVQTTKIRSNQFGTRLYTLGSPCGPPRRKDKNTGNGTNVSNVTKTSNGNSIDCASVKLPMTTATDPACLPRLVLLPSFPTSGNGMTRNLFRTVTGLFTGLVRRDKNTADFWNVGKDVLTFAPADVCGVGDSSNNDFALPQKGRVLLTKTHWPAPWLRKSPVYTKRSATLPSHVVRLVRNPGDNVLRNAARWSDKGCNNRDAECFRRAALSRCGSVVSIARDKWARHHDFWSTEYPEVGVPAIVVFYERLSVPVTAAAELRRMLAFVGEDDEDGWVATPESAAKALVAEPAYEQGTLLAAVCGIETAREMRSVTKRIDDELGYAFDHDRGAWYLPSSSSSPSSS